MGISSNLPLDILVVDDDEEIRNMLWTYLTNNHHHDVVAVESVNRAMDILLYKKFHIAYIDHMLPEIEGADLCEYLYQNHPEMKIALISASPDRKVKERAGKIGIRFVGKPFQFKEILAVVEEYRRDHPAEILPEEEKEYTFDTSSLDSLFCLPKPSERVAKELLVQIGSSLNNLYHAKTYTENDRARAYYGIIAAKVLGIKLPKREGKAIDQIYDQLMEKYGKKKEFS